MKLVNLLSKPLSEVAGIVGIPNAEDIVIPSSKTKKATKVETEPETKVKAVAEGDEEDGTTEQPTTPPSTSDTTTTPTESETKPQKALLLSDDRFTLLQFNHVKMHLIKEFSENAVVSLGDFDKKKTYVISEIIKPSEFESFDPSKYSQGEYVFVYADVTTEKPGEPPKMRKPMPGYAFTPQEYVDALNDYNTEMAEYTEKLEAYKTAVKEFIESGEASKNEFGWLIQIINDTQYKVVADFSFETTKDTAQFGVMGKLPKEVATKVTKALGGFAADDSIKGLTIAEIIEKALGLEVEEDLVGKLLPEEKEEETESKS